jgi:hypothetical protein
MDHYTVLIVGVMVGGIFVAATGVVGGFLFYATAQDATEYSGEHAFRPSAYQPMKMLTHGPIPPEAPAPAASSDVAAAA